MKIPIEVSARHVHLSQKDLEKLFGKTHKLKPLKKLSQAKDFAAKEELELIGKENLKARVLGPTRKESQAEISITDAVELKTTAKLKISGDHSGATKIIVKGPKGKVKIPLIIAKRHLHISPEQAKKLGLKNNQKVSVNVQGPRAITFEEIPVRIKEGFKLSLHLDTDQGNAAGIREKTYGELIK